MIKTSQIVQRNQTNGHANGRMAQSLIESSIALHVVVPILPEVDCSRALQVASDLANRHDARVTLLIPKPTPPLETSYHWLDALDRLQESVGTSSKTRTAAVAVNGSSHANSNGQSTHAGGGKNLNGRQVLQQVPADLRDQLEDIASLTVRAIDCGAGFETEIARLVEAAGADLIVVSGRSQGFFRRALPSAVRRLLRSTNSAVVLV